MRRGERAFRLLPTIALRVIHRVFAGARPLADSVPCSADLFPCSIA